MPYCDFSGYQAYGGKGSQQQFERYCLRAGGMIDRFTLGAAKRFAAECEEPLAIACTEIIDILLDGAAPGVASVSNDGYSVSYGQSAHREQERACYRALANALGSDPYGLLYTGVMR